VWVRASGGGGIDLGQGAHILVALQLLAAIRIAGERVAEEQAVIISGVVVASRPEHLAEVGQALDAIAWAEVHFSDPRGRLVVTIEAADLDQSADRLKELQGLPRVLMAELAQYCIEEEELGSPNPGGNHEPDPT
jgi:nitrate reductase NapAB chaperone NapD